MLVVNAHAQKILSEINTALSDVEVSDKETIEFALLRSPLVVPMINQAKEKIREYFGKEQKVSARLDYESDSMIWLGVMTELSAGKALPILDRFDNEWWFDQPTGGNLMVTLEYV